MAAAPVELEQAAVRAVGDADEQRLPTVVVATAIIPGGAERDAGDLPEQVDLLRGGVTRGGVVDVDEVGRLGNGEEASVRRVPEAPDGADPALQHRHRPRRVAHVPQPARPVLVPRREHPAVGVPRRREWVVQVTLQPRHFLRKRWHKNTHSISELISEIDFWIWKRTYSKILHVPCQIVNRRSGSRSCHQEPRGACRQGSPTYSAMW